MIGQLLQNAKADWLWHTIEKGRLMTDSLLSTPLTPTNMGMKMNI